MHHRIKGKIILLSACGWVGLAGYVGQAQVVERGLTPAANTYRSYQDASLNRDSGLYQPLNLLNDFYPSIEVHIAKHDNVRRRPEFQEEDLLITAMPSLGYRTNFGRHKFYAAYNGTFTFHQDLTQEDADEHGFNTKLGLDLSRRWDLELFGSIGETFERRGISGSRDFSSVDNIGIDSGPGRIDYLTYGADLIFGRKIGLVQGVLGYDYRSTGYTTNNLDDLENFADSRDRTSESIHLDINWQFADRTSVFGRVQKTDIEYDRRDNDLDSSQVNYLLGLRWKPVNSLSGALGVGVTRKDFSNPAREDFDGSVYYANLGYAINPFSNLSINASRTIEEPGDVSADFYESDLIALGWSHALTPRWSFDVYAKSINDDFNNGRRDDFFDWGGELTYAWRSWLSASLYYGEIERESNLEGIAYDDRYFGLKLRSDLRHFFKRSSDENQIEPISFGKVTRLEAVKPKGRK